MVGNIILQRRQIVKRFDAVSFCDLGYGGKL